MKVNVTTVLKAIDGTPLLDENKKEVILKNVLVNALMNVGADEGSGEDKLKRYLMSQNIFNATDSVELSAEDISKLKELVGKGYGPIIVGPVFQLLEGKE